MTLLIVGCGGGGGGGGLPITGTGGGSSSGTPITPPGGGGTPVASTQLQVSGNATKGPLRSSTITLHRAPGAAVGSTQTDASGGFSFTAEAWTGAAYLTATGGTYIDEATGQTRTLGGTLSGAVSSVEPGKSYGDVRITPLSHLVVRRALALGAFDTATLDRAANEIGTLFGGLDPARTAPISPLAAATSEGRGGDYGLVLGAISRWAQELGVAPETLGEALAADFADGVIDGRAAGQPVVVLSTDLSQRSVTGALLSHLVLFAASSRNASGTQPSENLLHQLGQGDRALPDGSLPVADVGPDQTVDVGTVCKLTGGVAGRTTGALAFSWRQLEGPDAAALSSTSAAGPTFTPTAPGTYLFELTVSDGGRAGQPARARVVARGAPGNLHVRSVACAPAEVTRGQPVAVTVTVQNLGKRAVNSVAVTPTFRTQSQQPLDAEYAITGAATNPTSVAPGASAVFAFTVTASAGATLGEVVVDAAAAGVDTAGQPTNDASADQHGRITVKRQSALVIESIGAPAVGEMGRTARVTAGVRNDGEARGDITSLVLSFRDGGGADRTAQYTVTPVGGNPTQVASGARATLTFDVAVPLGATPGAITIDGTVRFTDANSGATAERAGALATATWNVVIPRIVYIEQIAGPAVVSRGQSATVTVRLNNATLATAALDSVALRFTSGGAAADGQFTVTPSGGNPTTLSEGQIATLSFTVTIGGGAPTGAVLVNGTVTFTANGETRTQTGAATPLTWTVQTPANLVIGTVAAPGSVSQGQTAVVAVPLTNTGQAAVSALSVTPRFATGSGQDRAADYIVTPAGANPTTLAGGASATASFNVTVRPTALLGLITIDASASGTDANSGSAATDGAALAADQWLVQTPAALTLISVTASRSVISQGQTFNVTLNVVNPGGATVNVNAPGSGPVFTGAGGANRASFYGISPAGTNPSQIAGGTSATLRYTITAAAGAPPEVVTIDGTVAGIDANSGASVSSGAAGATAALTVQAVASFDILSTTGPAVVLAGSTVTVTMTVRNPGGAPANVSSNGLSFRRGGTPSSGDYTVTPVTAPATLAAGATSNFVYSVLINPSATFGLTTVDGTVGGTDANSGASISDGAAAAPATWVFATPGQLSMTSTAGPPRATLGQTINITMNLSNPGGSHVDLTASSLVFRAGPTDVSAQYTVVADGANPVRVNAGSAAALRFTVTVTGGATTGNITVDGSVSGTDATFGGTVSDSSVAAPLVLVVQTPPALSVSGITLPALVSLGQTARVTVTVANAGQATANLGATTLAFTGSANRTSEYTVTPVAGNPTSVNGGASAALRFDVFVTPGATREVVALSATVNGTDANSGAAVSGNGPAVPPSWTVQSGAALSIANLVCTPGQISQGQTFGVTVTVANGGEAQAQLTASALYFNVGGTDRTSQYTVTPRGGNPTQVAGGASADLGYTATASGSASAGIADVTARVTATDANSGAVVSGLGPLLPFALTVQRLAALDVVSVQGPATISQGQTRNVTVNVRNTGDATANGVNTNLTLRIGATDRTSEYTRALFSGPASISGNTTASYVWQVTASVTATTGAGTVNSSAAGTDANSGVATSDAAATSPLAWTVLISARLSLPSVLPAPAAGRRVSFGQTFPVTMNVANIGGNAATFTQSLLSFTTGVTNRDADFVVLPRGGNPTGVNPAQTVPLVFDVTISTTASAGTVDIDGRAHGTDDVAGITTGVTGSAARGRVIAEAPPALAFQAFTAPQFVSIGHTFALTATVRNNGGAAARLDDADFTFAATDLSSRDANFTVGTITPVTLAGGGAVTSFSVPVTVSALASAEDIDASGIVNGTDVNSGAVASTGAAPSPPRFTLQAPAAIQVLEVQASRAAVSQGQTAILTAVIQNTGQATARPGAILFSFTEGVTDRTSEYVVTPRAGNPATIPGGQSRALSFDATVSPSATRALIAIDVAQATAYDVNSGLPLSAPGAAITTAWTVQRPAGVHVTEVTASPGELFQLETLFVTLKAENSGEASLLVTSVALSFVTSGADDTAEYVQTPALSNPTALTPGTTGVFQFTVSVGEDARVGLATVDGALRGKDANSGANIQDATADVTATVRIKDFDPFGPKILYSNPSNGCLNVMTNTLVFLTFDRPMDGTTFSPAAFSLVKLPAPPTLPTTLPITSVVRVHPNKQTWELVVPSTSFEPATTYAVIVSNLVKDFAGNPCQGDAVRFSTSIDRTSLGTAPLTSHTTRPDIYGVAVRSYSPPHQTHNVPTSAEILVRWRAPVDPATISTATVRLFRITTPVIEIPLTSAAMELAPTATVLITPSVALSDSTTYGVMVTNNVRDYTGFPVPTENALFATGLQLTCGLKPTPNVTYTQPSPDDVGPQFFGTNPTNCQYNIIDRSQFLVTFNEPVDPGTIGTSNFRIWEIDGPVRNAVTVNAVAPWPSPPNTYSITPASAPLTRGSSYIVSMDNRVRDALGNRSQTDQFFFSTVIDLDTVKGDVGPVAQPTPDTTGPQIRSSNLGTGENTVCTPFRVTLTETVTATQLTPNVNAQLFTITISQGVESPPVQQPIASIDEVATNQFEITPVSPLQVTPPGGQVSYVNVFLIGNRVTDPSANATPGESYQFQYNSVSGCCNSAIQCCCGNTIKSTSPWTGKMNVTTDTRILVSFGEPADPSTIAANVRLFRQITLAQGADFCASVSDFPGGGSVVPCAVVTATTSTGTYELLPLTNGGRLLPGTSYAIIQSGGGLLKPGGQFFPCGPLRNYAYFTTANDWIPIAMGMPPAEPDQSKLHRQAPPTSVPLLYSTTIVSTIPSLLRHNQRTTSRLFVSVDSTIDPSSITTRSLILQRWTVPPVPIPVTDVRPAPGPRPNTFEIIPSVPLLGNTTYSMHLTNRATALNGTPAAIDEIAFMTIQDTKRMAALPVPTTQPSPDYQGPLVKMFSPPRKRNVHPANDVWMTFNEDVDPVTVTVSPSFLFFTRDVDLPTRTDMTRTVTVTPFGGPPNTFVLTPAGGLSDVTTYGIFVTDNVRDVAGNFSGGHESFFETRIETSSLGLSVPSTANPSQTGPFFARSNPNNARLAVPTESRILMTLSTDVDASNLATGVFLRKISPLPVVDIPATVAPITTPARTFELFPSVALVENTTYAVFLTNRVHDGVGRPSPTDEFYFRTQIPQISVGSQTPTSWATLPGLGPLWSGTNPRNLRHNVQPETRLIVTFNKPIESLTDPRSVVVAELTTPTVRRIALSGPITQLATPANTYDVPVLSAELTRGSTFGVFLTNRVSDTLGFPSPGDSFRFSTSIVKQSMFGTIPTSERGDAVKHGAVLAAASPGHARVNVSPDSRVTFTFNTTVTDVDDNSVFVLAQLDPPATPVPVAGTVSALPEPNTFEWTPQSAPLALVTTYGLFITNRVRDGTGRHSPGDEYWFSTGVHTQSAGSSYTTSSQQDLTQGPVLAGSSPANGRHNVQVSTRVLFTFNQAMNDATLDSTSVSLIRATTPEVQIATAGVSPVPNLTNTYELLLAPGTLTEATTYVVAVNNRAESADGKRCRGDEFFFSTSTILQSVHESIPATERADVAKHGPVLLSSNPFHDERNVHPASRILFTFNTSVTDASVAGPGAVVFKQLSPGPEAILASSVSRLTTPENTYRLTAGPLSANTTYAVFVTNRVETPDGRVCPGDEFKFSTSIDNLALNTNTAQINPAHTRLNIMRNTRVLLTFSQPVSTSTLLSGGVAFGELTTSTFTPLSISNVVPVTIPANTFDIQYSGALTPATTYGVFVTNLAENVAGEPLPSFYSNFSTSLLQSKVGAAVTTAMVLAPSVFGPSALEFNPPHLRVNILPVTRVFLRFPVPVKDVTTESVQLVTLTTPNTDISLSAVTPLTYPANTFEVVPSAPLSAATTYGMFVTNRVRALSDHASPGNDAWFGTAVVRASVGSERYTTTVTSPDVVGPYVLLSNPNNRARNVPLNSSLLLTFNKSVVDSSIVSFPDKSVALIRLSTPVIDLGPVSVTKETTPANTYRVQRVPPAPLSPTTTYALIITNNIRDELGNHAQPGSVIFSTTIVIGGGASFGGMMAAASFKSLKMGGVASMNAMPLLVVSQLLMADQLSIGEDAPVVITLRNDGTKPVSVDSVGLSFGNGRAGEFDVRADPRNPRSVPPSRTVALGLTVSPRASANPAPVDVAGTASGTEDGTGRPASAVGNSKTVDVALPARLSVRALLAPALVQPGGTAAVRATLANSGHAPARIEGVSLAFRAGVDRGGEYSVSHDLALPATLAPGATLEVPLTVTVASGATPFESVTLAFTASAVNPRTGAPLAVDPHPWAAWTVGAGGSPGQLSGNYESRRLSRPAGMAHDGRHFYLVDSANARVLVFDGPPASASDQPVFVLGGPAGDDHVGPLTFRDPAGIACDGTRLALADAGHNRVLIWDELPTGPGSLPARVLGQSSMSDVEPNAGGVSAQSLSGPAAVRFVGDRLFVADTRNHRVLAYPLRGDPAGALASLVLGQASFSSAAANTGGVSRASMSAPSALAWDGTALWVADTGNRRVLGWEGAPASPDDLPRVVLGQPDFTTVADGAEHPEPAGLDSAGGQLFVADRRERTVRAYLRDAGSPLSTTGIRSAVLVPYTGGPALAAPAALMALPGRLYLTDPPADRVVLIGR